MPTNIHTEQGEFELPADVREQATSKTSIYHQGELVYDGATGTAVGPAGEGAAGPTPEPTMSGMLKWGIENSSPEELARRKAEGGAAPSQIDKEIIDMILGQPTVAKMRECLGKLDPTSLSGADGLDNGAAALEELEYYVEDLDNALDLVKIQGLPVLQQCAAFGLPSRSSSAVASDAAASAAASDDPEGAAALREAACGVLASMLQNHPAVQNAARASALPQVLLHLLGSAPDGAPCTAEAWEATVGGLAVVRKALLALSALVRFNLAGQEDDVRADAIANLRLVLPTLCRLAMHTDTKLCRRALFVLAASTDTAETALPLLEVADTHSGVLPAALVGALSSADEDTRTQAQRILVFASRVAAGRGEAAGGTALYDAAAKLHAAMIRTNGIHAVRSAADKREATEGEVDPEEGSRLRQIVAWLESSDTGA